MSRFTIFLTLCFLTNLAFAQEGSPAHSGEIYALGGVASEGIDIPATFTGVQAGGAWQPFPQLSMVADFSRIFGANNDANLTSFMAGPRFHSADRSGVSGFLEVLAGAEHINVAGQQPSWSRVYAAGAGVDIRIAGPVVWHAVELDAMLVDKSAPGIPGIRCSSGLVVRLGH